LYKIELAKKRIFMQQYEDLLRKILETNEQTTDRTGEGTLTLFGPQMEFDLQAGFPAVTTKQLAWKAMFSELLWFIEGSGDEKRLREILHGDKESTKPTIWTANAQAPYWLPKAQFEGDLGRVYGVQWRHWRKPVATGLVDAYGEPLYKMIEVDQLANLIHDIKNNSDSRRLILNAWNVGEIDQMALPPCHVFSQFKVINGTLHCKMYQRSADFFLGVPFNIASYALFTHMLAQVCDLKAGKLVHTFGDAHIYLNHIDAVKEQLSRKAYALPTLYLNPEIRNIDDFTMNDAKLIDYQHHPAIKAPMAV
jgi:thymidylate synthase